MRPFVRLLLILLIVMNYSSCGHKPRSKAEHKSIPYAKDSAYQGSSPGSQTKPKPSVHSTLTIPNAPDSANVIPPKSKPIVLPLAPSPRIIPGSKIPKAQELKTKAVLTH